MRKLLSANFVRLWKDKIFWLGVVFMFGFGIFGVCTKYSNMARYHTQESLDDILLLYVIVVSCCAAVFCSMFLGTEYSDGTIRNKLIVGHLRSSVYLANWLTSIAATVIMTISFLISYGTLGFFLLKPPKASAGQIHIYLLNPLKTLYFQGVSPVLCSNLMYFPLFLPLRAETRESFFSLRRLPYPAALRKYASLPL